MVDEPVINASYRWTLDEFLQAQSLHYDLFVKPKNKLFGLIDFRIFAVIVAVLAILRLLIDLASAELSSFEQVVLAVLLGLSILYLSQPWFQRRTLTNHYKQRPDREKLVQYRIDSDAIRVTTEGMSSSRNKWSVYQGIVRTSKGFLLYPNDVSFQWLPNHAFATPEEGEAVAGMARRLTPKYTERK